MKRFTAVLLSMFMLWGCAKKEYCTVTLHYRRAHAAFAGEADDHEKCENNLCEYSFQIPTGQKPEDVYGDLSIASEKGLQFAGWFTGKNGKEYLTDDLPGYPVEKDLDLYASFSEPGEEHWFYGASGWWFRKKNGYVKDDWVYQDGEFYHFNKEGNMDTGWYYEDGHWYFLKDDGVMARWWLHLNERWYYFDHSGSLQTGRVNINGQEYCFYPNGVMAGGWFYEDHRWYYYDAEGQMKTGLFTDGEDTFFFDENGVMVTNDWRSSEGTYHWFGPEGKMVRNSWVGEYYLDENGERAVNRWIGKYHVGPDGKWDDTRTSENGSSVEVK